MVSVQFLSFVKFDKIAFHLCGSSSPTFRQVSVLFPLLFSIDFYMLLGSTHSHHSGTFAIFAFFNFTSFLILSIHQFYLFYCFDVFFHTTCLSLAPEIMHMK